MDRYGNTVEVQGGSILALEVCREEEQIWQHLVVGARDSVRAGGCSRRWGGGGDDEP